MKKKHNWTFYLTWLTSIIVIGIVGIFFYHLNVITGYTGDDFLYHFIYQGAWPTAKSQSIDNIFEFAQSIYNHTMLWNGRFVAHSLVMLLMQVPKVFFNIANTVVFLLIGVVIQRHLKINNTFYLIITYMLMFLCLPDFGRAVLWLSGSCNYLWMGLLYLIYLLPILHHYVPKKHPVGFTWLMVITGFFIGATNENIGIPILLLLIMEYMKSDEPDYRLYTFWSCLPVAYGSYFLLSHNIGQAKSQGGQAFQIKEWLTQFIRIDGAFVAVAIVLIIILIGLKRTENEHFKQATLLFGLAALSAGALLASPQMPPRAYFGSVLFSIIGLLHLFAALPNKVITKLTMVTLSMLTLSVGYKQYHHIEPLLCSNYQRFYTAEKLIQQTKQEKQSIAYVPGMNPVKTTYSAYYQTAYLTPGRKKSELWENEWMARYYGIKHIYLDNQQPLQPLPKHLQWFK